MQMGAISLAFESGPNLHASSCSTLLQKVEKKYLGSLIQALEEGRVPIYELLMAQVDFPKGMAKADHSHKFPK